MSRKMVYLTLAATLLLTSSQLFSASKPEINFLHFWVSEGEQRALSEIRSRFILSGGVWHEAALDNYESMKKTAISRIATGLPPSAVLWLSGEDDQHINHHGVLRDLEMLSDKLMWDERIYDFVIEASTVENELMSIPIHILNENWAWFSAHVYRELELDLPETWDEFLQQAPMIQSAGYMPLALSDEDWIIRLLFSNLVASVGNVGLFNRLYTQLDASAIDTPEFDAVVQMFFALREYAPTPVSREELKWSDATNLVIENQAAMMIMGDWAYAEFLAAGLTMPEDFICRYAPGLPDHSILAVDQILLPKVEAANAEAGQSLLAEIVTSADFQTEFSRKKGGTPTRVDIPIEKLNPCAARGLSRIQSKESRLFAQRITTPEVIRTRMQEIVSRYWRERGLSAYEMKVELKNVFTHSLL